MERPSLLGDDDVESERLTAERGRTRSQGSQWSEGGEREKRGRESGENGEEGSGAARPGVGAEE